MNIKHILSPLALSVGAVVALGLVWVALLAQTNTIPTAQAMNSASFHTQVVVPHVTASTTTTTTLSSSPCASVGQTVTFTATVYTPPGSGTPTGTVQFKADGANLGAAVTLAGHKASSSTSWSNTGWYTITAEYSGDASFGASTSAPVYQRIGCGININTSADSFILSNEPPSYLIHKLIAAGYGSSSLYTVTLYLKTLPSADTVLTDTFMAALAGAPTSAEIFTTQLSQYDFEGAVAVSTNGTVQIVDVYGKDYVGKPGNIFLRTGNTSQGDVNFIYTTDQDTTPLTSWTNHDGVVNTTYRAFAIAWGAAPYTLYLPLVRK